MEAKKYPPDFQRPSSFSIVSEDQLSANTDSTSDQLQFLHSCIAQKDTEILQLRLQLQNIDNHLGWKILKKLDPAFKTLFPTHSFQSKTLTKTISFLKSTFNFFTSRKSQLARSR
jgi:hypothetical protein